MAEKNPVLGWLFERKGSGKTNSSITFAPQSRALPAPPLSLGGKYSPGMESAEGALPPSWKSRAFQSGACFRRKRICLFFCFNKVRYPDFDLGVDFCRHLKNGAEPCGSEPFFISSAFVNVVINQSGFCRYDLNRHGNQYVRLAL